jgi:hypothetical protein
MRRGALRYVYMKAVVLSLLAAASLPGASYQVILAGLGGTPEYEQQFEKWAADLDHQIRAGIPDIHIETLSGAAATRERIREVFARLQQEVQPDDAFALVLIGHGTFDGTDYKFNIPGRDITAGELSTLMNKLPAVRQLIVNMTSCSGASIEAFARKNRVVITGTKSGNEKNATVFPRYWLDALRDPSADADKNGTVSALEAFRYAEHKTADYFNSEKLLATEHPVFTDTGSTSAVRDPKPENGQGLAAAAYPLLRRDLNITAVAVNPEKQGLLRKKQDLEAKIDRLKYQKAAMPEDEYRKELTTLLLDLARTQSEIDK